MPNWCDGNIRVRGTYDKIVKFFSENLMALKRSGPPKYEMLDIPVEVFHDDYFTHLDKPDDKCEEEYWFKDSRRQFMKADRIEIVDYSDNDLEEIICCLEGFHAAWSVDAEYYGPLAKKYGVDIKIMGFDQGLEFMEIAEFYRDGTVIVNEKRFNDWRWECPRPNLGG